MKHDYRKTIPFLSMWGKIPFSRKQKTIKKAWKPFLLLLAVFFSMGTFAQVNLKDGLVGHWSFDDGTAKDISGNNHNGEIRGSVKFSGGDLGQFITFDRNYDNYVLIPHNRQLNFQDSFTVSIWVKKNSEKSHQFILAKGRDVESTYHIRHGGSRFSFSSTDGPVGISIPEEEFNLNEWHFVTYVVDDERKLLSSYINGVLSGKESFDGSIDISSDYPLVFGRHFTSKTGGNYQYPADASIDEVRLYNRALSEDEVVSLYYYRQPLGFTGSNAGIEITPVNLRFDFNFKRIRDKEPDFSKYNIKTIKRDAKKGDVESLIIYADMHYYRYDKFNSKSYKKRKEYNVLAKDMYTEAANKGSALAQFKMAEILYPYFEAVDYYKMAAAQDYEPAIYNLAFIYLHHREDFPKEFLTAKSLLEKLPENDDVKPILAKVYLSPEGGKHMKPSDLEKAKSLLESVGQKEVFTDWVNRINSFGKFRYAQSVLSGFLPDIDTDIDYKNEEQVKKLIKQLELKKEILGNELIKKYTWDILNSMDVISSVINKRYEEECFRDAEKKSIPGYISFASRFPNSTRTQLVLQKIEEYDNKCFNIAKTENTVYAYRQYINKIPDGMYVDEALKQIERISYETEEAERLAKNKYEKNRQDRIKNAGIGEKLCFSQGWIRKESFLWSSYTAANYTMSIICFIEKVNGEKYQVRVGDVRSSKSGEYSSPKINGIRVNKGDVIWIRPLDDTDWHRCD